MSLIIRLFFVSRFVFLVRAYNESCLANKTSCEPPLNCIGGFCTCSSYGKTTDDNNPLAFWTGDKCIKCPLNYISSGVKCYQLVSGTGNRMNWIRAQKQCQESGGDLLVIRSEKEYNYMTGVLRYYINDDELTQRTPTNGTKFMSVWIGAQVKDWNSGIFQWVSHGPALKKDDYYWCSEETPLGSEPNHIRLKATGEHQDCVALALFSNKIVCMHDWFCSWDAYSLCEIHPPPPTPDIQALAESEDEDEGFNISDFISNHLYMIIGVVVVVILLIAIGIACCCHMCSKNKVHRTLSTESDESASSEY